MPIVLKFIGAIVFMVQAICQVLYWLLIVRIVLSWVGVHPYTHSNELLGAIYQVTDVVMAPFRRLRLQIGMIDLSPMIAIMALYFIPELVATALYALAGVR